MNKQSIPHRKNLQLRRETVRVLANHELTAVDGAGQLTQRCTAGLFCSARESDCTCQTK